MTYIPVPPQGYWAVGFTPADYNVLVSLVGRPGPRPRRPPLHRPGHDQDRHLHAATRRGRSPGDVGPPLNSNVPEVDGDIYSSAKDVRADRLGATTLLNGAWYTRVALVPTMPRLDSRDRTVTSLAVSQTGGQITASWRAPDRRTPRSPPIASPALPPLDRMGPIDPCLLADALPTGTQRSSGSGIAAISGHFAGIGYRYVVTALDRQWKESPPGSSEAIAPADRTVSAEVRLPRPWRVPAG